MLFCKISIEIIDFVLCLKSNIYMITAQLSYIEALRNEEGEVTQ